MEVKIMICKNCGAEITEGQQFCSNCGAHIVPPQAAAPSQSRIVITENELPEAYKPIAMWGYFGYQLLYAIPCIGFIFLVINALGSKNVNLKNYSRSYFCVMIVSIVISLAIAAMALSAGVLETLLNFITH